jgi:hypothetical protein
MLIPLDFAFDSEGRSIAARIAMMAITTSNSIRVKPILAGTSACRGLPMESSSSAILIVHLTTNNSSRKRRKAEVQVERRWQMPTTAI